MERQNIGKRFYRLYSIDSTYNGDRICVFYSANLDASLKTYSFITILQRRENFECVYNYKKPLFSSIEFYDPFCNLCSDISCPFVKIFQLGANVYQTEANGIKKGFVCTSRVTLPLFWIRNELLLYLYILFISNTLQSENRRCIFY